MIHQEHIEKFSQSLKIILEKELALGNTIAETAMGWPEAQTVFVLLQKPFISTHQIKGVQFSNVNDPHYWKAEYLDVAMCHLLACRF